MPCFGSMVVMMASPRRGVDRQRWRHNEQRKPTTGQPIGEPNVTPENKSGTYDTGAVLRLPSRPVARSKHRNLLGTDLLDFEEPQRESQEQSILKYR
jgi:hypothetical protein